MLTAPDENFTHQVSFPHAMVGSSDPSWRERYWVSFQDTSTGSTVVTFGFGQYPNQDVQEGFVCITHDGRQHNLRLSRQLRPNSHIMQVGPLSCEIVEPYEHLRFVLDDNEFGLAFDIDWLGSFRPFLEDRHIETAGAKVTHDLVRYVQVGRGRGSVRIGDLELEMVPDTWWGERDHSWGVRPIPGVQGAPPSVRPDWKFLMFLPLQFDDFGFHLYLFEDERGHALHRSCGLMDADGSMANERAVRIDHDLVWERDAPTPTLVGGSLDVEFTSGRNLVLDLRALDGRAHLRGGGYGGYKGWFQGHWKGESSIEHEVWDLDETEKLASRGVYSSDHMIEVRTDDQVGYGIVEYMVLPGHERYGYTRE